MTIDKIFQRKTTGKKFLCLLSAFLLLFPAPVLPATTGGVVTSGTATINQSGATTNINQSTNKAAINWNTFSIARNETVNFNQPSSKSMTLNRVAGNEKSVIAGTLNANGKVYLINSNGVLMTKGSSVNTAGFVASTLNITDDDFNKGNYVFQGSGNGAQVINKGTIKVNDGGYVALLGEQVKNEGVIVAERGTVSLNGATKATLNFNGDSLVSVSLDEGALNALVENKKAIYADGGKVILTAKAADSVIASQVNTDGIVQARTLGDLTGEIEVNAHGGTANVAGTLDASAPNGGNGGFIETSGKTVKIADNAKITTKAEKGKTGTWLIDPTDFTVATSGGDISGTTLGNNLNSNSVTIQSSNGKKEGKGDINVNDAVTWVADTTLTLDAENDININAPIKATGDSAGLVLGFGNDYHLRTLASYSGTDENGNPKIVPEGISFGSITLSGADASLTINSTPYILIHDLNYLQSFINERIETIIYWDGPGGSEDYYYYEVSGNFALAGNINASGTIYTDAVVPVFLEHSTFAGLGNTISNLTIHGNDSLGLFGQAKAWTTIRDIGLLDVDITGISSIGALAAGSTGDIIQAYVRGGTLHGNNGVGGLVGGMGTTTAGQPQSRLISSFAEIDLSAYTFWLPGTSVNYGTIGGLVGGISQVLVSDSHATGNITYIQGWPNTFGPSNVGGLVGMMNGNIRFASYGNQIINSYASGSIITADPDYEIPDMYKENYSYLDGAGALSYGVGGLVGSILVGQNLNYAITNSHATGDVFGGQRIGGLIGDISAQGNTNLTIDRTHATGNVTSYIDGAAIQVGIVGGAGGLVGAARGGIGTNIYTISNSYATGDIGFSGFHGAGAGGLVGINDGANISHSYATGNITSNDLGTNFGNFGGLVGSNNGSITDSYATGNVNGTANIGGLAGSNNGSITDSYTTGNVNGTANIGGLVGTSSGTQIWDDASGSYYYVGGFVADSYATGEVSGSSSVGALVGNARTGSTLTNSYYNAEKNSGLNAVGTPQSADSDLVGGGLTTEQMPDAKYYIDGTIDQVLAARARAAQAAAAARQNTINTVASIADGQQTSVTQALASTTQTIGSFDATPIGLEAAIVNFHESDSVQGTSASYSASIKKVSADGVTYLLEDEEDEKLKKESGKNKK
ncbi:MAG: filamentous hemagglutinin N-terminal domain-containing protein [Desulfovibrio sp.]|jgi:filamentous hemagglutinin family protein|nr:filamentous hemagglutinin N-terminal domain-containing protein [Desulfovibrio sp.]